MRTDHYARIALVGAGALVAAAGTALGAAPAVNNQVVMPLVRGALQDAVNANVRVAGGRVRIKTTGAVDVAVLQVTIPPGGASDWHQFAGPHFAVVKEGTVTFVDANCTRHDVAAGHADFATGKITQKNLNLGATPAVFYVTFLIPRTAAKPPIPQPAPAGCKA